MPFVGNLRTLPLPDVFQTLNNIKATGVLRLRSNAGSRDVVFQQGEIIGVGFLDKEGREDVDLRLTLLGIEEQARAQLKGATWYWTAMQAREHTQRAELDELVHEQAREQLHNLFAWNQAEFAFDEAGPGKTVANELVARSLERPLSIDTSTILLEAARQQDEWAELRSRIRDEAGVAAMGSSPALGVVQPTEDVLPMPPEDGPFHLYLDGEWQGPYPRSQIVGMVQTGEVAPETWSYDPRTQERRTLDDLLGDEARRITPEELESLRQAVKAAEGRLAEERAGRAADIAELRGLAGEILHLAQESQPQEPAIGAVVARLAETVGTEDPSVVALVSETAVVALVRHLRELGERTAAEAGQRADELAQRIATLEGQLADAEQHADRERSAAEQLRERLAAAAADAAHLDQELERARRDPSRAATARVAAGEAQTTERVAASLGRVAELERELGRMRAEHARLLSEVANLQARLDEDRARHEAELEASRALAASLGEHHHDPPTEKIGKDTETVHRPTPVADAALLAEIEQLKARLAEAERRGSGSDVRKAIAERDQLALERDAAHADTQRLRRDLQAAREAEAGRAEAAGRLAAAERRLREAEAALAEAQARTARAEESSREHERTAYEAARQNTQLQVRLRELAARLDEGEARLAAFGDLAGKLAEARARADALAQEGTRIRADLAAVRADATHRLERAKNRVRELRDRLRQARRERSAQVPWPSPATAAFAAAPAQAQAQVPWPSPLTATFTAAPAQPQAQVPWPSPATAAFAAAPAPEPTPRTTSGSFVPMPMPDESSAGRPRVLALAAPARANPVLRWGLAAAAALAIGSTALWWAMDAALPICERAQVNGRTVAVLAPIAGRIEELKCREGDWIAAGARLATVRNHELDQFPLENARQKAFALRSRIASTEAAQRRTQAEHDRLATELAAAPEDQAEARALARLRDDYAARMVELAGTLDELRLRQTEAEAEVAATEQRLAREREAPLDSQIDGLVYSIADTARPHGANTALITLIRGDSLVIDAELPAGSAVREGDLAKVQFGGSLIDATVAVIDPITAETRDLALSPPASPGSRRVLLTARNAKALASDFARPARIAFLGRDPGLLTHLGLRLRF